jgi:hypothetical protein
MTAKTIRILSTTLSTFCFLTYTVANAQAPLFHLKNKSGVPIQVNLSQGKVQTIAPEGSIAENFNIFSLRTIGITYCPNSTYCKTNLPMTLTASFIPGDHKTIYVKFDIVNGQGTLTPQKGNVFGKTTDGYSLSKNIDAKNIQESNASAGGALKTGSASSSAVFKELVNIDASLRTPKSKQDLTTLFNRLKVLRTSPEARENTEIKNYVEKLMARIQNM